MNDKSDKDGNQEGMHEANQTEDAFDWVVRMSDPEVSGDTSAAFSEWLASDPGNAARYAAAAETYDLMTAAELLADRDKTLHLDGDNGQTEQASSRWYENPAFAIAATVFLVFASVLVLRPFFGEQASEIETGSPILAMVNEEHRNGIGKPLNVDLADGSQLILNTATRVRVTFTNETREIELLDGEVQASVAANPDRPFSVKTDDVSAVALETIFTVRREENQTRVFRVEGRLRIDTDWTNENEPEFLEEGQMVTWHNETGLGPISEFDAQEELAWTNDLLVFEDERLDRVLEEINRYQRTQYELSDPSLGELKVTAVFRLDALDDAVNAILSQFDLRKVVVSTNRVSLRRAPPTRPN